MGFWDKKLAPANPAPHAPQIVAPGPAQPGGAPWWATGPYSGQQGTAQPTAGAYAAQQIPQEPGTWGTVEGSLKRAKSARLNEACPECGSGNFGRGIGSSVNVASQCMNCGYNTRFGLQSGSGIAAEKVDGPAKPSVQAMRMGSWDQSTWLQDYANGVMDRVDAI